MTAAPTIREARVEYGSDEFGWHEYTTLQDPSEDELWKTTQKAWGAIHSQVESGFRVTTPAEAERALERLKVAEASSVRTRYRDVTPWRDQ